MNGTKEIAQRIVNAENNFAEIIVHAIGCDIETAHKITTLYLKNKLAKMDAVIGRISVKHGVYLEKDVLQKALEMV